MTDPKTPAVRAAGEAAVATELDKLASAETGTAVATTTAPPTLAELVAQFRATESNISAGVTLSVAAQIRCGELLQAMQERVAKEIGSGHWGAWVQLNCGVSLRQVQRYIRRAKEFHALDQKVNDGATSMSLLAQGTLLKLEGDAQKKRRTARR
ncbi:hypothetical protein [Methylosinus sp. RM1]|uniref:hypothetical protein n=1 Tax=Methylosinus sp. RM1 TaxID=2583817 RepID=UPI00140C5A73|nr:hypothetical protein [Methylosinus sp. RM1]